MPILAAGSWVFLDLDQVKAQLNIDSTDDSQDAELMPLIDAAQGVIERHTGKLLGKRSVSEVLMTYGDRRLVLDGTPLASVDAIAAADGSKTYDASGVVALSSGLALLPYSLCGAVTVTYTAGSDDVSANVTSAGLIIVQHLWDTQRGSMPPVLSPLDDSIAVPGIGYAIPNRALELLGPRPPVVA